MYVVTKWDDPKVVFLTTTKFTEVNSFIKKNCYYPDSDWILPFTQKKHICFFTGKDEDYAVRYFYSKEGFRIWLQEHVTGNLSVGKNLLP